MAHRSRTAISAAEARRIALAAQGFADPQPAGEPGGWDLRRVIKRVGLLQIDSVNVLEPRPLPARLQPPRPVRDRPPRRALLPLAAAALRVLGPRGVAAAGRPPPAVALADGARPPRRLGRDAQDPRGEAGARRRGARPGPRARADRRLRADRRAAAPIGAVVGLVGVEAGARVAVLGRRGLGGEAAALRAPLRRPRARDPRGDPRRADAAGRRRPARAAADRARARSGSPPSATCATTSGCRPTSRSCGSPSWSRRAT